MRRQGGLARKTLPIIVLVLADTDWLWCNTLQELLNILNLNCFLTLKYSRQKLAGVSMLCNGNHLFLQQSDPSVCILQIRLTLHIEMSSDWTFLAGFSVSTSSTLWHWTDKKNQKYFLLLVFYRVEQSQQQVECEYCSGILSALYLISTISRPAWPLFPSPTDWPL